MIVDAGVLSQGGLPPPSPKGLGSLGDCPRPIRFQQRSQRRDRRFPGGGAESPPRTPPHGSRYGTPRLPGTSGNHFLGRRGAEPLFSPSHRPSPHLEPALSPHTSRVSRLSRRTHLELRPASRAAQGHSTQAHRNGAEGSALAKATWKRKAGEDCTCAGRLGHNWLRPTVKMATEVAHAHKSRRFCPKEGTTAGPGGGQT